MTQDPHSRHRRGVGRHQRVEIAEAVEEIAAVEARGEIASLRIHIDHKADVTVVDLLVVVVLAAIIHDGGRVAPEYS